MGHMKAHWIAKHITGCVNFGYQASARAAYTLLVSSALFCSCRMLMVWKILFLISAYSLSTSLASALKAR
jgi:hypothetical protein